MKTILLHALRAGETRDYMAELITAKPDTAEGRKTVAEAKAWAMGKGFHAFTQTAIVDGAMPDFARTVTV